MASRNATQPTVPTFDAILKLNLTVRYPLHAADLDDALKLAKALVPDNLVSERADVQDYHCTVVGVEAL